MGVKNLWDILESCKKTLPLNHLQNKRVCIDLSCWMVQLQKVNKSHCPLKDKLYLRCLFHRLRALIALNCSLIFVTDGSIPAIKLSTYRKRLNSAFEVPEDDTSLENKSSLRRNMGSEFSCMIKEAKVLGLALGIPCLDGIEEAEAQCALLNSESFCEGCFTSDSDIFLFGARTVYRDICLGEGGHVVCYEMADIESKFGFGRNSLITLALCLGSDYFPGVHGLGPESACQIVKSIGDDDVLQRIATEGFSIIKKTKGSKKQGQLRKCSYKENSSDHERNINGSDLVLQAINAYLKPKCHSADSDAVQRILVQKPIQRAKLQQICSQFFDWPPEKTDEYILPKIAERNLRRFANLRSTSSELGVKLLLQEIPVKCPVSEIIKPRKAQGKECFEVLWEEQDGLATSIVPADLIQSACPEKIAEFEEKRARKKKQISRKPRLKKTENKDSLAEIDLKLKNLVFDIESESNDFQNGSVSSRSVISSNMIGPIDIDINKGYPNVVVVVNSDCNSTMQYREAAPTTAKEVINLLSPSPVVHHRLVSKCQQGYPNRIDVIDLSESEPDMSPEHEKKARELRSFLVSIKDTP